jgi:UDP-N-acetylmuramoyl-tripeptide--D-alanyl-D-alanine ligase
MLTESDIHALRPTTVHGPPLSPGTTFTAVSTDSRSTAPGELFVALRGERFDGHSFVGAAFRRGARAALIEVLPGGDLPQGGSLVVVPDTLRALGALAGRYRRRFTIPVVAIAGSNGKTTTKEMAAAVLRAKFRVLSSEGNFNNEVGVPLTLFRLRDDHEIAVVELGTNHPGELARLCRITGPTHGLVTNIGREHLEFFETLAGVAREEGTLFRAIRARGTAIVNADDSEVMELAKGARKRMTYGFERRARVTGRSRVIADNGCVTFTLRPGPGRRGTTIRLAIPGEHNADNALAAAAVGVTFGVAAGDIKKALEGFNAIGKRMEVAEVAGITILNDTYNANPDSVRAALRTLASVHVAGKRIAVLADMKELGNHSALEHTRAGDEAARLGIDYMLTFGEAAGRAAPERASMVTFRYDQKNMLAEELVELVAPGDAVLIKGSRSMRMEDVVTFLLERLHAGESRS